jgi:hypothetical protein
LASLLLAWRLMRLQMMSWQCPAGPVQPPQDSQVLKVTPQLGLRLHRQIVLFQQAVP